MEEEVTQKSRRDRRWWENRCEKENGRKVQCGGEKQTATVLRTKMRRRRLLQDKAHDEDPRGIKSWKS